MYDPDSLPPESRSTILSALRAARSLFADLEVQLITRRPTPSTYYFVLSTPSSADPNNYIERFFLTADVSDPANVTFTHGKRRRPAEDWSASADFAGLRDQTDGLHPAFIPRRTK